MLTLGLDIGTTTLCAVVVEDGRVLEAITRPHDSFLTGGPAFERAQDVTALCTGALALVDALTARYPVERIGITGQQHGIVYLNDRGEPLSPLYTWQDGRGNQPLEDGSYASVLSQKTGYAVASGYGLVTHYYNMCHGLVPPGTAALCTVHDYVAMVLCGLTRPVTEPSDAQSLGFYDLRADGFDLAALQSLGIDPGILPRVVRRDFVGKTKQGIGVCVPIGDNPASFLGATDAQDCVLLNIGTGSQISVHTPTAEAIPGLEARPYPLGGFLQVGAALCGGRAWAMTERFFSDAVFAFTGQRLELYEKLDALLDTVEGDAPSVTTTFDGTRAEPHRRAAVQGLSRENFTPGHLALGVLQGMIRELYDMYDLYLAAGNRPKPLLVGSGNGLRKNRHLRAAAQQQFGLPLRMTDRTEEAAVGAALFAAQLRKEDTP